MPGTNGSSTAANHAAGHSAAGSILIVDDEPVITPSLSRWLAEDGYDVGTASSAAEALRRFQERRWDVAFLDIMMPGMDGLELQHRLHEIDPHLQIVVMTNDSSIDSAVRAVNEGAFDYLP